MKKAVISLSWWLDSTTLLYHMVSKWYEVEAISFYYWQNHSKELDFAALTCKKLNVRHTLVDISFIWKLFKSSLLSWASEIPEWHYEEESMKSTVVPSRNLILASICIWYAQSIWAEVVALWVHWWDHAIYPDCRKEFIEKLDKIAEVSDWNKTNIYSPFIAMNKWEIVKEWLSLDVDFSLTWTCYKWWEKPCWVCWSCQERAEAFEVNNSTDPTV